MKTTTIEKLAKYYGKSSGHINNLLGRFCFSKFKIENLGHSFQYLDTLEFRRTLENLIKTKKYLPKRKF